MRGRPLSGRPLSGRPLHGWGRGYNFGRGGGLNASGAFLLLQGEAQGLALDFTDLSAVVRDTGTPANNFSGDVNSLLTYTSPSAKFIRGANGIFTSGTTIRTEYNVSGAALGARIESARTNLALRSALQGAVAGTPGTAPTGWAFGSSGGSTAVASAGNKLSGFDALEFTCASGARHFISQAVTVTAATYTYSALVEVISGTPSNINQVLAFANFTGITGVTNRVNGATTSTIGGAGLYFLEVVVTFDAGDLTGDVRLGLGTSGNLAADCSIRIHYAQLELGAFATSPIVTAGSTVTRAVDDISLALASIPFDSSNWTLYAKAIRDFGTENNVRLVSFETTDSPLGTGTAPTINEIWPGSGGVVFKSGLDSIATGLRKWASSVSGGTSVLVTGNGATPASGTTDTFAGRDTEFQIGKSAGGSTQVFNGHIAQIMFLPRAMTGTELQTLTS